MLWPLPPGRRRLALEEFPPAEERIGGAIRDHSAPEPVALDDGSFLMGANDMDGFPADGEGPVREVELSAFAIEPVAVSNRRFAEFVDDTGHVTDGEHYGWSFVFGGLIPDEFPDTRGVARAPWWREYSGRAGAIPRALSPRLTSGWTTRSSMSPGVTPMRSADGLAYACRPRPNGIPEAIRWPIFCPHFRP